MFKEEATRRQAKEELERFSSEQEALGMMSREMTFDEFVGYLRQIPAYNVVPPFSPIVQAIHDPSFLNERGLALLEKFKSQI